MNEGFSQWGEVLQDLKETVGEAGPSGVRFWSLPGLWSYADASALQRLLVEKRAAGELPDTVLFLEHRPVITRGRGLQWTGTPREERQMPAPQFLPEGFEFCESERGGDLTYHGPGQLVAYPILKLDGHAAWAPNRDIALYLRGVEAWLGRALQQGYGLEASMRPSATGVWVGEKKIASIGVAVRKWVTWHGIALNVVNDLKPFHLISPCGFSPEVMTRLQDLCPPGEGQDWRAKVERALIAAWRPTTV